MQITRIEEVDKKRRTVFIDGVEAFTLYKNEVYKYKLEQDAFVKQEIFIEILEVLNKRAKLKVMEYLTQSDKPEADLRSKLKRARYPDSCIEVAIDYVKSYGYINDLRYTENYIRTKKVLKSKQAIQFELKKKGIDAAIIKEAMDSEYSVDTEMDAIKKQIAKKCRDTSNLDRDKLNKLVASLCRKGFSYDKIKQCLSINQEYE